MTAPRLEFELEITPALLQINRIASRFSNWEPLAGGKLDVAVRDFFKRRFESEGRVGGGGQWRQLTSSYASFKAATGRGRRKILQYDKGLMRAFTEKNAEHQILRTGPDLYVLTVDETIGPRARGHQRGNPNFRLPKRRIIPDPIPKNFLNDLKKAVRGYVVRGEQ